ncbi:MAG: excinuclease ABC subunit A [Janthinobacterium lividum]
MQGHVRVRGAREHNLKNVDVDIPRNALVVFTGVSGSGKSSLAFGTLYAEAQRRYLESVSPYARRLFNQMPVPEVDQIDGLPPAVALQQQRGAPTTRSSVGSVTTLANLLRMLYSRAGDYPAGQELLYAESFSPNTPEGACTECHGLGRIYEVTEQTMVPDPGLTIRERAVAAWPTAWHGQNLREILMTLGYDVDIPWRDLPKKQRDWILFTDEQPVVPVYSGFSAAEVRAALKRRATPSYQGTFTGARKYVLQTFAGSHSALMKKRVAQYMRGAACPVCTGKRLQQAALSVRFAGFDIADMARLPLKQLRSLFAPYADAGQDAGVQANSQAAKMKGSKATAASRKQQREHPEKTIVKQRIAADLVARLDVLLDLGLGYLSLDRATPTLSPGELQRLRLATQVRSNLFGVVYVLDEPSAGLHPADTEALLSALARLKAAGNSLFVVEHDLDVIRQADWIVDVGPDAGEHGGTVLYSGPPAGLQGVAASRTRHYLFDQARLPVPAARQPSGWIKLAGVSRNNLQQLDAAFPRGLLTSVTGVSGSGKSSLVSQALVEMCASWLGQDLAAHEQEDDDPLAESAQAPARMATDSGLAASNGSAGGGTVSGMEGIKRLVRVDQKPIGRTPRSNLATYTGLFDQVRKLFAQTDDARKRRFDAGRFSFNVAKGRCATCQGEGQVMVELLFLPSVYAPCPACHGARFNDATLAVHYQQRSIADVLRMTVDSAAEFFADDALLLRALTVLREVGLGYLRLGQSATELSGGEAQRVKLATELQRPQRGDTLYILDEPSTGLHPLDVDKLMAQLKRLVDAGNTVIVVEHEISMIAASDWIIDIGPGAGDEGGEIVACGTPAAVAASRRSRTAPYLRRELQRAFLPS